MTHHAEPRCPVCGTPLVRLAALWHCPAEPAEVAGAGKSPDWPRRHPLAHHAGPFEVSRAGARLLAARPYWLAARSYWPPPPPQAAPDGSWVAYRALVHAGARGPDCASVVAWWTAVVYTARGLPLCSARGPSPEAAAGRALAIYRVLIGRSTAGWTGPVLAPCPRELLAPS